MTFLEPNIPLFIPESKHMFSEVLVLYVHGVTGPAEAESATVPLQGRPDPGPAQGHSPSLGPGWRGRYPTRCWLGWTVPNCQHAWVNAWDTPGHPPGTSVATQPHSRHGGSPRSHLKWFSAALLYVPTQHRSSIATVP